MKKERVSLQELSVNSFVTAGAKGGLDYKPVKTFGPFGCQYFTTQPKTCQESFNWCWTP